MGNRGPGSGETTVGGEGGAFPATAWSQLVLPGSRSPEERRRQLERLALLYWKPIYHYIRVRWQRSNEDAKDLTQKFFVWIMETDLLSKVRLERGRFRNFVKVVLNRFVQGDYDAEQAVKRGGRADHVNLDFITGADEPALPHTDPEQALDEHWRRTLIEEAMLRLKRHYEREGKPRHYELFEDFYGSPEPAPSYQELAERHGLSVTDVTNYLARARGRYRAFIEEILADSVTGLAELRDEFEELFREDR